MVLFKIIIVKILIFQSLKIWIMLKKIAYCSLLSLGDWTCEGIQCTWWTFTNWLGIPSCRSSQVECFWKWMQYNNAGEFCWSNPQLTVGCGPAVLTHPRKIYQLYSRIIWQFWRIWIIKEKDFICYWRNVVDLVSIFNL